MDEKLMTVGEIAKKANVSVRTLQYYDKSGLLKPSAYSEGGNRLYSSKELVILYQIKGLKHMGLTLNQIKSNIISLDKPEDVIEILQGQKEKIVKNIESLKDSLSAIELLEKGIEKNNRVDFAKYAKIIANAHDKMNTLWFLNVMDLELSEYMISKDKKTLQDFGKNFIDLIDSIIQIQKEGIQPHSCKGQDLMSTFWSMVEDFIDEDDSWLPSLVHFSEQLENFEHDFAKKWEQVEQFITEGLEIYLRNK